MIRAFLVLIFLITGCIHNFALDHRKAQYHLQIGTAHMKNGSYPAAMSEFLKANKLNPKHPVVKNNLGLSYFSRRKMFEAEKHLKEAVQLRPKYTDAKINLGRVYMEQSLYQRAIKLFKEASEDLTYHSPFRPFYYLGLSYYKLRNNKAAQRNFQKAISSNPYHCLSRIYLAQSFMATAKASQALEALNHHKMRCSKDDKPSYLYYKGLAYYKSRKYEQSAEQLRKLLDDYPSSRHKGSARKILREMQ